MSGRFLFVCGALLLFGNVAFGEGTYQRTKDGKTIVWNNDPQASDEAAWSGARDREGYATGFGTLTWYMAREQTVRRLGIPFTQSNVYASYFGNMVHGKFNGPVNVHSKGNTGHAIFADGVRTTLWAAGTAPSRRAAQQPTTVAKRSAVPEPEAPAEAPTTRTVAKQGQEPVGKPTAGQSKIDVYDSLRLLVWPPRTLRWKPRSLAGANPEVAPPAANARLTKEEVIDLADAEARARGYDLAEYQRPEPQYDPADQTWSLLYDQKPVDGTAEMGKHFSVAVGDKTKGRALVAGQGARRVSK